MNMKQFNCFMNLENGDHVQVQSGEFTGEVGTVRKVEFDKVVLDMTVGRMVGVSPQNVELL